MKKKELLEIEPLRATAHMIHIAEQDEAKEDEVKYKNYYGYEGTRKITKCRYGRYFMAAVAGDILKVAVFTRLSLRQQSREPVYEVYVNRKENTYLTYETETGKWRTAKINMLEYEGPWYLHMYEEWQTDETRKLVNDYFETGKYLNVFQAVLDFQSTVKQEALDRKHKSEIEQIDATMKEVPELPKDFDKWVIKNCFKETLFYERERPYKWPKVYCTHCGQWMDAPAGKPVHGAEIKCPKCGVDATYRSWNKQKYVTDETDVAILQRLKDRSGYILRSFHVKLKREHDKGWETTEFSKFEDVRQRMSLELRREELFEYGEYKYTGVNRWCHQCRKSQFGYYNYRFGNTLMYTPNLKRELKDKPFVGMNLKKMFRGGERKRVDPTYILGILNDFPFIEYLQKSGLHTLISEIMRGNVNPDFFDSNAKRINEVLKLNKQEFARLKKIDGGKNVVQALRHEQNSGSRLTDENLHYIKENKIDTKDILTTALRTEMTLKRMLNYLIKQADKNKMGFQETRRLYNDYLDMAEERGMDITDEIVSRSARMHEYHDRYAEEKNREEKKKRDQEVDRKFPQIRKDHKKNAEHFTFETKEYVIVVPEKASDITREGRLQHHCVGASDQYMNKMAERETFILFLRRQEDKNVPYYTLEVKWDGSVIQWYGAYDRKPDKEKITKILDLWTEKVKKRILNEQKEQEKAAKAFGMKKVGKNEEENLILGMAAV